MKRRMRKKERKQAAPAAPKTRMGCEITREPRISTYANGDLECSVRRGRISRSACVVQNYRQPDKCRGCRYVGGQ